MYIVHCVYACFSIYRATLCKSGFVAVSVDIQTHVLWRSSTHYRIKVQPFSLTNGTPKCDYPSFLLRATQRRRDLSCRILFVRLSVICVLCDKNTNILSIFWFINSLSRTETVRLCLVFCSKWPTLFKHVDFYRFPFLVPQPKDLEITINY